MKKIAGILGAAVAATAMTGATPSLAANSFAELLEPVPNAVAALKADDARVAEQSDGRFQVAQWHHHHHHHHHRYWRRHHHHHHHRFWRRHHHHHHHHHWRDR